MQEKGIALSCIRRRDCRSCHGIYHRPLRRGLEKKGFEVVGEFSCRGYDTYGALWLIGGLNRKHPDEQDLLRAERFAEQLSHELS